ncbi:MAG: HEAT repeat domain-containing protein, partial [Limisphaerales bacterium]
EAGDNQIRNSAIATLASWMSSRPEMAAALNQELLQAINSSNNVEVRGNALQVLALHLPQLPDNFTSAAADYLKTDPSPFNRAMAARALGEANDQMKEFALQQLEQSYSSEESLETKRAILSAIVRAGTTNSTTILQRLPASAPLAEDVTEYLNILQGGVIDRDEIQRQKSVRHAEKESPAVVEKH